MLLRPDVHWAGDRTPAKKENYVIQPVMENSPAEKFRTLRHLQIHSCVTHVR